MKEHYNAAECPNLLCQTWNGTILTENETGLAIEEFLKNTSFAIVKRLESRM